MVRLADIDDVRLEVPDDLYLWPDGQDAPEPATLCRSLVDAKSYEVFKRPADVPADGFERTGMAYGGIYSESHWEHLARDLPQILDFYRIPDDDPPGILEAVLRDLGEAR